MCHDDVFEGVNRRLSHLSAFVGAQAMNAFKEDLPDLFEVYDGGFLLHRCA